MFHDRNRKHGKKVRETDDDGLPPLWQDHLPQAPQVLQLMRIRQVSEDAHVRVAEEISF